MLAKSLIENKRTYIPLLRRDREVSRWFEISTTVESLLSGPTSNGLTTVLDGEMMNPIAEVAATHSSVVKGSKTSSAFEVDSLKDIIKDGDDDLGLDKVPDMWYVDKISLFISIVILFNKNHRSWPYVGLYSQYAAVGLLYGKCHPFIALVSHHNTEYRHRIFRYYYSILRL